jgi:site-specific recombinase XerD
VPLDLYRRHVKSCPDKGKGINHTACNCPVWADGPHPLTGKRVRRSIGTRDWSRSRRLLDRWESDVKAGDIETIRVPELSVFVADFIKDCSVRKLAAATIASYGRALGHFAKLCQVPADEIDVSAITAWRNARAESTGRKNAFITAHTLRKEIEFVRVFCEYLVVRGTIPANPARKVKAPRNDEPPTLPFTPDEVKSLLAAVDQIDNNYDAGIERARLRARALVLLLLYSGMRISDAIQLKRSRVDASGRLMVRMMKTGGALYVRLPKHALKALAAIPVESEYFLWSGKSKLSTAVGSARRTIDCLGRLTNISAHPHRFRDTFSVELLKTGASLRTVQLLLGHTSI